MTFGRPDHQLSGTTGDPKGRRGGAIEERRCPAPGHCDAQRRHQEPTRKPAGSLESHDASYRKGRTVTGERHVGPKTRVISSDCEARWSGRHRSAPTSRTRVHDSKSRHEVPGAAGPACSSATPEAREGAPLALLGSCSETSPGSHCYSQFQRRRAGAIAIPTRCTSVMITTMTAITTVTTKTAIELERALNRPSACRPHASPPSQVTGHDRCWLLTNRAFAKYRENHMLCRRQR
jgi:hypothetical protein